LEINPNVNGTSQGGRVGLWNTFAGGDEDANVYLTVYSAEQPPATRNVGDTATPDNTISGFFAKLKEVSMGIGRLSGVYAVPEKISFGSIKAPEGAESADQIVGTYGSTIEFKGSWKTPENQVGIYARFA